MDKEFKESVPLHVVQEERERRRALEREVELLKEMVMDAKKASTVQNEDFKTPYDEYAEKFEDETKKGIEALIEKKLSKERKMIGEAVFTLMDKNDELEFKVQSGRDYETYSKRVNAEIADMRRKGINPPPRSVLYKTIKNEELAKKIEDMEKKSRRQEQEIYSREPAPRRPVREEQISYDDRSSSYYDSLDGSPAADSYEQRKPFSKMTLQEKEKALSNLEL
jgi:hypothetical protein